jgi:hypothetical protein
MRGRIPRLHPALKRYVNRLRWTILLGVCAQFLSGVASAVTDDLTRMQREIELRASNGQFMGSVLVARAGKVLLD